MKLLPYLITIFPVFLEWYRHVIKFPTAFIPLSTCISRLANRCFPKPAVIGSVSLESITANIVLIYRSFIFRSSHPRFPSDSPTRSNPYLDDEIQFRSKSTFPLRCPAATYQAVQHHNNECL